MVRAAKICPSPDCPNLQPCAHHQPQPWTGNRRARTTSGWEQQRRAQRVMAQHDGICHRCKRPGSDEVDHVIALSEGGADTDDNLRPIHSDPCHKTKTAQEAARARRQP